MGSIFEFNRYAAKGKDSARKYCMDWSQDIMKKNNELSEQLKLNKIDKSTYNMKRAALNRETKDLNGCVEMVNK